MAPIVDRGALTAPPNRRYVIEPSREKGIPRDIIVEPELEWTKPAAKLRVEAQDRNESGANRRGTKDRNPRRASSDQGTGPADHHRSRGFRENRPKKMNRENPEWQPNEAEVGDIGAQALCFMFLGLNCDTLPLSLCFFVCVHIT